MTYQSVSNAYTSHNVKNGSSYILMNFGGIWEDIVTLGHELGHAFHFQLRSERHPYLAKSYGSLCMWEVAAGFDELLKGLTQEMTITRRRSN